MNKSVVLILVCILSGCQNLLPETFHAQDLALTSYEANSTQVVLPIPRSAGEKRRQAWEKWLQQNRDAWNTQPNQTAQGKTRWCVQWQQDGVQRICNRNNQTLVWFGYGQTQDEHIIRAANKIWIGR